MGGRSLRAATLFDRNARRYDAVNTVITFGQDRGWRLAVARRALKAARAVGGPQPRVLDACGGTGLVAGELARAGAEVTLADVSAGMLHVAGERLWSCGLSALLVRTDLAREPAAALPGAPFAAATLAFGLRYFDDPVALLRNLVAALAPGGAIVLLEAVVPSGRLLAAAAHAYFFAIAPRLSAALAGNGELAHELTSTVRALGTLSRLLELVAAAGLKPVAVRSFAHGAVVGLVLAPAPSAAPAAPFIHTT